MVSDEPIVLLGQTVQPKETLSGAVIEWSATAGRYQARVARVGDKYFPHLEIDLQITRSGATLELTSLEDAIRWIRDGIAESVTAEIAAEQWAMEVAPEPCAEPL